MAGLSRRIFLTVSGGAAVAPRAGVAAEGEGSTAAPPAGAARSVDPPFGFFNNVEAAFIAAAVDRLIPPDELGPGAAEAGVPQYIDRQLHGAWGSGERLYRSGPWLSGKPTQGYQLPFTPAELFRTALRGITADIERASLPAFAQMSGEQQDTYLTQLQKGERQIGDVPAALFFETLLAATIEGYFGDPAYGGNRDMAAWRMIGFPGAHAAYYDVVDQHNLAYGVEPVSLAESAQHAAPMNAPPRR